MFNALTIDLEDWFQGLTSTSRQKDRWPTFENRVVANTEKLLRLLAQAEVKVTFFVLGYLAQQYPDLIKRVVGEGHEIALHSYDHRRVHQLTPEQFRQDVIDGLKALNTVCGNQILGYRAPMFSINSSSLWALEVLREMGFRYDSSIFPIRNLYYGIPNAPNYPYHPFEDSSFLEFPLATVKVLGINWPIGGGFYLRTLPYSIVRSGIRKLNRQGRPAILYLHPWELDLGQQYKHVTPRERITHYHGRASLERKLRGLLSEFKFTTLSTLMDSVV